MTDCAWPLERRTIAWIGDQFVLMERLGQIIVGAEAQALHFILDTCKTGENEDGRLDLGDPQCPQDFVAGHVGKIDVEKDDVVVVELAESISSSPRSVV